MTQENKGQKGCTRHANTTPIHLAIIDGCGKDSLHEYAQKNPQSFLATYYTRNQSLRLKHQKLYRNERCWEIFLTGEKVQSTGSKFNPKDYTFSLKSLQKSLKNEAFYEKLTQQGFRVCSLDIPGPILYERESVQVSGWGNETSSASAVSNPPNLIEEIIYKFGNDPKKVKHAYTVKDPEHKSHEQTYSLPDIYDQEAINLFSQKLKQAVLRRERIAEWISTKYEWDLFVTVFTEFHTANHMLWHVDHPELGIPCHKKALNEHEVLGFIDQSIQRLHTSLDGKAMLLIMTLDETTVNSMDIPSMVLLPELLYRWCFETELLGPYIRTNYGSIHWKNKIWSCTTNVGKKMLLNPVTLESEGDPLSWQPASWYRDQWKKMKAFALPSVGDGYIRINVKDREQHGIVEEKNFQKTMNEIIHLLEKCNTLNGKKIVDKAIATRARPREFPNIDPDIIIKWTNDAENDSIQCDSLRNQTIGPFPMFRSGGHKAHGATITNEIIAPTNFFNATLKPDRLNTEKSIKLEELRCLLLNYFQGDNRE